MGDVVKNGLDYFPFDIGFFNDLKVRKLIHCQGGKSITVYTILLCIIYRNGYYVKYDDELKFILCELSGYTEEYIHEVVTSCIKIGLFDKDTFKDRVLTSQGIQKRVAIINKTLQPPINIREYNCLNKAVEETIKQETKYNDDKQTIDHEIEELKASDIWLDNLQLLHHCSKDVLLSKMDDFKLQCVADGKLRHENITEAKRHFNNWLRKTTNYDRDRTNGKDRRRGNILSPDAKKTYSDTF